MYAAVAKIQFKFDIKTGTECPEPYKYNFSYHNSVSSLRVAF